ncbi:transporter substrate-binding domain-containing protein [Zhihengliuella halotolerans]|uniref:Amino acid ABC transporter substrate-binding protein (PAAT family) n=1 Tax=Zhihengliuella halotolerans TaxID=370736 RepID=A0A4Q8AE06_9MICC|nr:transporter substrate-binding domain-containing protein [Zhihengliuella halotolerans]RZU62448.1 amino acid ABC transporter substrate-binding protein (PAAT family) [Zhihengliuella halotolerans]
MNRFRSTTPFTRRALGAAAVAGVALTLAACGSAGTDDDGGSSASGVTWESVEEAGELQVGTEGTYRPFSYTEEGSGDLIGYDVEVMEAVGKNLGIEVKFSKTEWDGMFAGLDAGRFDTIANQVTMTPEREEKYLFSTPYTVSTGVVVTLADDDSVSTFEDLEGKRTAQSATSNWRTLAEESGAQIEPVEGWAQSVALLEQGRVDATVNDKLTVLDYLTTEGNDAIKIAAETEESSTVGFVFPAGSESTVEKFNEALAELAADGTLAEISEKYFGDDVSK